MDLSENVLEPSLYSVRAAIIQDRDGHRLLAKTWTVAFCAKPMDAGIMEEYYDDTFPSVKEQQEFEKRVFHMRQRSECEVLLVDGVTVLCQRLSDVTCYIVGGAQENELLLLSALTCICESLSHMLRKNVDRSTLLENMDTVWLILDEIIDQGVILESESEKVVHRLSFKTISEPALGFVLFDYLTGTGDQSDRKRGELE